MNIRKHLIAPLVILLMLISPVVGMAAPQPVSVTLSRLSFRPARGEFVEIQMKVAERLPALWVAVSPVNNFVIANPFVSLNPVAPGIYVARWSGLNSYGKQVPAGDYLITVMNFNGIFSQQRVRVLR